ncbi:5459_t:CDS:2, partial [Scutellospora calospora]
MNVRVVAQGMIMLGTAYIGGKLLAQSAVSAATTAGQARVGKAAMKGLEMANTPYMRDDKDTQRIQDAVENMDAGIARAATSYQARTNARMTYAVGRAFAGATRLFSGGKGSYQSGINEFIHNKAHFPPLRVEARTSKIYQ